MSDSYPVDSTSSENAAFVTAAYRQFLGRQPDPAGLEDWIARLDEGMPLDVFRGHIIASQEFHTRSDEEQLAALSVVGEGSPRRFCLDDVETVNAALNTPAFKNSVQGGTFNLPSNFDPWLDPRSDAYREQQLQLWRTITQRQSYNPAVDEDTPEVSHADVFFRPAFYGTGDTFVAGDHLMALGHMLRQGGLRAGSRALEYGAGFGQIALAFARTGVHVDTVDINPAFSAAVSQLGERYNVELKGHVGVFGDNPRGEDSFYDLVYFYESFHHCFDFFNVIPRLRRMLKPGGRVMMAGEPIMTSQSPLLPYPWGVRLDGENVCIMRQRGWMELGFQEDFLVSCFKSEGFKHTKYPLDLYHYCTIHSFELHV
ncbi:methyltransferase domain-containing protein [Brevundimonas sp.]|uniref:methyltransferase domain-containing protein n=1 Tax=Brevundimonas sp. TaxID=1871086 RepID=UPI0035B38B52